LSSIQVTVLDVVAVLPQASVAIHVLVLVVLQPVVTTRSEPNCVGVSVPQLSVAVASPIAALIAGGFCAALHKSVLPVRVGVIKGATRSSVHVTVLDVLAVFPQPSTIDHDLI